MDYQDFLQEMQGDPFRGLMDDELGTQISAASGPCAAVLREILRAISGGGMIALSEAADSLPAGGSGPRVNTFPFGTKTHSGHPDYIGIACTGKTSLRKVLNSAEKHCWDMELGHWGREVDKTVIILTDKWDQVQFQRDYEKIFLRYALRDRVLFLFFLVNHYGVSRIPFLPRDRRELDRLADSYQRTGVSEEEKALALLLRDPFCEYTAVTQNKDGEIATTYRFHFVDRTYRKETHILRWNAIEGQMKEAHEKDGKLDLFAILEFAAAVYELDRLPPERRAEDPPFMETESERTQYILTLSGRTFRWGPGLGEFEKIRNAAERLVGAL